MTQKKTVKDEPKRPEEEFCLACMQKFGRRERCIHCGATRQDVSWTPPRLKPGTIIHNRYLIGRCLGQGGYAITYLGLHLGLNHRVAIKEFYPSDLVDRQEGTLQITPRANAPAGDPATLFKHGLARFLEEGRSITKCHQPTPHPNIVRVTDIFEENGTAYLVMDYLEGISLEEHLRKQPSGCILERELMEYVKPVLEGLKAVHRQGFLHRDIKPGNIYITKEGNVLLIDFGAARETLGKQQQTLTVTLTPGYAPPEQYSGGSNQGPWSDVYGVAATMYRCITGETPPSAMARLSGTPLKAPNEFGHVRLNGRVERAILGGLELDQTKRIQSPEEMERVLQGTRMDHFLEKTLPGTVRKIPWSTIRLIVLAIVVAVASYLVPATLSPYIRGFLSSKTAQTASSSKQANQTTQPPSSSQPETAAPKPPDQTSSANTGQSPPPSESAPSTPAKEASETPTAQNTPAVTTPPTLPMPDPSDLQASAQYAAWTAARSNAEQLREQLKAAGKDQTPEAKQGENLYNQASMESDLRRATSIYRDAAMIFRAVVEGKPIQDILAALWEPAPNETLEPGSLRTLQLAEGVSMDFVWIPPGSYYRGSTQDDSDARPDESPRRNVRISRGFWMSRFEVTVAQFAAFAQGSSYRTTAEYTGGAWILTSSGKREWRRGLTWMNPPFTQGPDHPVTMVSWDDAKAFCAWLSERCGREVRLPSEAEWEYTCRAGTETRFYWGNDLLQGATWMNAADICLQRRFREWVTAPYDDGYQFTAPVGSYQGNAWGLYDMHGNVWEWCEDWYSETFYTSGPDVDPLCQETENRRCVRGGSWLWYPVFARSSMRMKYAPSYTTTDLGFRVVLVPRQ